MNKLYIYISIAIHKYFGKCIFKNYASSMHTLAESRIYKFDYIIAESYIYMSSIEGKNSTYFFSASRRIFMASHIPGILNLSFCQSRPSQIRSQAQNLLTFSLNKTRTIL
jgi:hypothetical protein